MFGRPGRLHLGRAIPIAVITVLGLSGTAIGATPAALASASHHNGAPRIVASASHSPWTMKVSVLLPTAVTVKGTVSSLNDTTGTGTCANAGMTGSLALADDAALGIARVAVTSATTFADAADPSPSFAVVCVGSHIKVMGTISARTLTAAAITVEKGGYHGHGRR